MSSQVIIKNKKRKHAKTNKTKQKNPENVDLTMIRNDILYTVY